MALTTLHDLLVDQLRDIYFAEKHLTKALPKMAKAANDPALKAAFQDHLAETRGHVERLEQVFDMLDVPAKAKRCPAIIGLVEEGGEMIHEDADAEVRDAGLIASAQRVEHYEIAAYGCARAFAKRVGRNDVARILTATIEEEGACDKTLTKLAEGGINTAAVNPEEAEAEKAAPRNGRARTVRGARSVAGRRRAAMIGSR